MWKHLIIGLTVHAFQDLQTFEKISAFSSELE